MRLLLGLMAVGCFGQIITPGGGGGSSTGGTSPFIITGTGPGCMGPGDSTTPTPDYTLICSPSTSNGTLTLGSGGPILQTAQEGLTAALPATCFVGQIYTATDATAGENLYTCTASNTWTQQGLATTAVTSAAALPSGACVIGGGLQTVTATTADCSLSNGVLTLGSSGVLGAIIFNGATSGSSELTMANTGGALVHGNSRSSAGTQEAFSQGTNTASSGTSEGMLLSPTYNQTSTAGGVDIFISRTETALGSGTQAFVLGEGGSAGTTERFVIDNNGAYVNTGPQPTLSGGCATSTQVGGMTSGSFVNTSTCTTSTFILTFATTAPHFWRCDVLDFTTSADTWKQTARSSTACTVTGSAVTGDVMTFIATPY
jgi:hypothetical protein